MERDLTLVHANLRLRNASHVTRDMHF